MNDIQPLVKPSPRSYHLLDSERVDTFEKRLRALCDELGFVVSRFEASERRDDPYTRPELDIDIQQMPPQWMKPVE